MALTALALLLVVASALSAHSAVMGGDHAGDAAALCLIVGASGAVVAVAAFALRCARARSLWLVPAPLAPALPFVTAAPGFLARAGPPPLLPVLRL